MTGFLASVTCVDEAEIALDGGAGLIDLKNPAQGALGALPVHTLFEVVHAVARRRPVSATVGDLPMQPELLVARVQQVAASGVDIVKVGLFGTVGHHACIETLASCAQAGVRLVAVLFADQQPDFSLVPELARAGFHGVMLDTAGKGGGRLTDWLDSRRLSDFVTRGRALGLLTGLAGALRVEDIPLLLELEPDYLGFRSALCQGGVRTAALDPQRVRAVAALVRQEPPGKPSVAAIRLHGTRSFGYSAVHGVYGREPG